MSNAIQTSATKDSSPDLTQLTQAVAALPREYHQLLEPLVTKVVESQKRRHQLNKLIQEALTQLRLDIKYLEFDLQATRAERDEYKEELERFQGFEFE
ncbi:MAG: transcriptional regulator [Planctomycetales bacterium]|nr:transcriptional regulator [Planctomycetales bacterium]